MNINILRLTAIALFFLAPVTARAQGVIGGVNEGAAKGDEAAGPVGAVVGGIVGGVFGGIGGLFGIGGSFGIEQRRDFRNYVQSQHLPSDEYRASVAVGNQLPQQGVHFYDFPPKYGIHGYQYAVVNNVTVLVDPMTRKIVEVENW